MDKLGGPNPPGPDDGYASLDAGSGTPSDPGEQVISSRGMGLLQKKYGENVGKLLNLGKLPGMLQI